VVKIQSQSKLTEKPKLPSQSEEQIIDVSLKHLVLAFSGLVISGAIVGTSIILVRDFARYKRQKAIIGAATNLFISFQNTERKSKWKEKKKPTVTQSISQPKK